MASDTYPDMSHVARKQIQQANWQVANITTPANYFHVLRRQIHRPFRKPVRSVIQLTLRSSHPDLQLVIATPKSLLRLPAAKSPLAAIDAGTHFQRFIPEIDKSIFDVVKGTPNPDVKRLVLCSGKVYYDLVAAREKAGIKDVAIARVEQISPFPFDLVHRHSDVSFLILIRYDCGSWMLVELPERRGRVVPGGAQEPRRVDLCQAPHCHGTEQERIPWRQGTFVC